MDFIRKTALIFFSFIVLYVSVAVRVSVAISIIPREQVGLFGMDTPAGSGRHLSPSVTTVCKVTNLHDSGHGSLRYCVEEEVSPKVIVFEVSGNIELKRSILIGGFTGSTCSTKGNYITIAGQTAPSPGITLKNYGLRIERNCHDILVQHLRIRPGDTSFYDLGCDVYPRKKSCTKSSIADPLTLVAAHRESEPAWTPPYNIVVDHNSFSWGGDMNIQTGGDSVTFSNNITSEALANPLHPKGKHSKGFCVNAYNKGKSGGQKTAIINNLISHNWDRNPYISAGSAVIANNLLYDVGGVSSICVDDHTEKKGPVSVTIVGNHIIDTSITKRRLYILAGHQKESRVYLGQDNYLAGKVRQDPWNYSGTIKCSNWPICSREVPESNRAKTPEDVVWPVNYTTMPVKAVKNYVLSHAGARPADRDEVDNRIVNNVINRNTGIIESQEDVGGWPDLENNRHVLVIPTNYNEIMASGYTRLEEWLHRYSRLVEKGVEYQEEKCN